MTTSQWLEASGRPMLHTRSTLVAAKDSAKDPMLHDVEGSPWQVGTVEAFWKGCTAATGAVWSFKK